MRDASNIRRPKPHPCTFRREIELEDLAAVAERWHPIAPVAHVTDDRVGEFEDEERRPPGDRDPPPRRAATRDHPLQLAAGDYAAVRLAPRGVMNGGDVVFVAHSRGAYGDDRFDHEAGC